jgi:hypothetical protein
MDMPEGDGLGVAAAAAATDEDSRVGVMAACQPETSGAQRLGRPNIRHPRGCARAVAAFLQRHHAQAPKPSARQAICTKRLPAWPPLSTQDVSDA